MERKIKNILAELGLKQYLPGFQYIIEAEMMMKDNRHKRLYVIYREIGEEHGKSDRHVYQAIKWVIDNADTSKPLYKKVMRTEERVSIYMFVNSLYLYLWEDRQNED